jgi:hypothetical protein
MSTLYKWLIKFVMKIGYKISLGELGLDGSINQLPHNKHFIFPICYLQGFSNLTSFPGFSCLG